MSTIKYIHTTDIHNTSAAKEILPYVFEILEPSTILDIGCGTGSWLNAAKQFKPIEVLGIDGIHVDESLLAIDRAEFFEHDLRVPLTLSKKFDLALCLEVAEHLPGTSAENIVKLLTDHADVILFSAAIPGQGGQNHINEQWPSYWQKMFEAKGFLAYDILRNRFWENPKIDWWYRQNIILYAKSEILAFSKFKPTKQVMSLVHPELYQHCNDTLKSQKNIIQRKILHPSFFQSLKLLLKSLIK